MSKFESNWSAKEIDILRTLYPDRPTSEACYALNRSYHSVSHKAKRLGIEKSERFRTSDLSGRFLKKKPSFFKRLIKSLTNKAAL